MTEYSYQLYSSRNFPPIGDTLKMLAGAGYTQVEGFGGVFGSVAEAEALRKDLDANGLTMPTAHFSLALVEDNPDEAQAIAKALGVRAVFIPFVMPDDRPTDGAGWKAFGKRVDDATAILRKAGLKTGWHNHDFEFRMTSDGVYPQEALMEGGPNLMAELDLAWIIKGGEDPVKWVKRYADRVLAVHLMDIAPDGENADEDGWADVGHGTVDFGALRDALKGTSVEYMVIEHDNPSDHERFAKRSIDTAKAVWSEGK